MPTASTASAFGREAVEPLARGHRLVGVGVVAEPAPVALALDRLVRDRSLDDQHERLQLAPVGLEEPLEEVVGPADRPALEVDQRPVDGDLREAGQGAEGDLLDARLGGGGEGDGVAVAAQAGVDPQDVDDGLVRIGQRHPPGGSERDGARASPPGRCSPAAPSRVQWVSFAPPIDGAGSRRRRMGVRCPSTTVIGRRPDVVRPLPPGLGPGRTGPPRTCEPRPPVPDQGAGTRRCWPPSPSTTSPACGRGTAPIVAPLVVRAYDDAGGPAAGRRLLAEFQRWAPGVDDFDADPGRSTTSTPACPHPGRPAAHQATADGPTRSATASGCRSPSSTTTTAAGWSSTASSIASPTPTSWRSDEDAGWWRAGPGPRASSTAPPAGIAVHRARASTRPGCGARRSLPIARRRSPLAAAGDRLARAGRRRCSIRGVDADPTPGGRTVATLRLPHAVRGDAAAATTPVGSLGRPRYRAPPARRRCEEGRLGGASWGMGRGARPPRW